MIHSSATVIPPLLKHMALSIYDGPTKLNHTDNRLRDAIEMARTQMFRYGHITVQSEKCPVEEVTLTPLGATKNRPHMALDHAIKTARFDKLYEALKSADPPKSKTDPKPTVSETAGSPSDR